MAHHLRGPLRTGFVLAAAWAASVASASAQSRCVVTDPTGTPLNVRAAPQGDIVGTLANGVAVRILDQTRDTQGKRWARVSAATGARGWVFRDYVTCAAAPASPPPGKHSSGSTGKNGYSPPRQGCPSGSSCAPDDRAGRHPGPADAPATPPVPAPSAPVEPGALGRQ